MEVVGRAGIGTTIFEPSVELDVRGSISVSGVSTFQSHVHLGDDDELRFGANNDLKISHNGSASNIQQVGTGPLQIRNEVADQDVVIQVLLLFLVLLLNTSVLTVVMVEQNSITMDY